jgi:hypothetical protein
MLSNDEHSGLFAFVIGLVIVVFAAIALSIAVDRRFSFSSNVSALETETGKNETNLGRLMVSHKERSWSLSELEPKRTAAAAELEKLEESGVNLERRAAALIAEREKLATSIPVMEEEFARYRAKYRTMVREAAIGEPAGDLTTLSGREYAKATITRVTDSDLEISHAHGFARIASDDLGPAWRDRFHWGEEEEMDRNAAEDACRRAEARPAEQAAFVKAGPEPRPAAASGDSRTQMLRHKVIAWRAKVSQLSDERNRALSAAQGSQASVTGALETWQARAERLGLELRSAEEQLAAAEAELAISLRR